MPHTKAHPDQTPPLQDSIYQDFREFLANSEEGDPLCVDCGHPKSVHYVQAQQCKMDDGHCRCRGFRTH